MGIVLTATFFMKTGLAGGRLIFLTRALDSGVKSYGLNAQLLTTTGNTYTGLHTLSASL